MKITTNRNPQFRKWSEMSAAERQSAAALRLDQLEQARLKLEQGVTELVRSGRWEEYLKFLSRFRRYSFNNLVLILLQRPAATQCASYRTWKQLGRQVRQGERGIEILVPILARVPARGNSDLAGKDDALAAELPHGAAGQENEPVPCGYRVVGFKIGHTFDVSQTEGAPLPSLINMSLAGSDRGLFAALAACAQGTLGIAVELVEARSPTWGGACRYGDDGRAVKILVAGNRSPLFRAQTLAHELGHALLHSDQQYRRQTPRSRIECEAESVAFCILHHFGLDAGEVAFGYLAHWGNGGNALTELLESGERIRAAAHQVIAWIEEQYVEDSAGGMDDQLKASMELASA